MPKQTPWKIRVQRKTEILAEFVAPAHKLQRNAVKAFLKALVVRHRTSSAEEMLPYYVCRTRGNPEHIDFAEVHSFCDPERRHSGYFCGDWECMAVAEKEMDADIAEWLKKEIGKNRAARNAE